jgi:hypothetical protein
MIARVMTRLVSWGLRALGTAINRAGHVVRRTGGRSGSSGRSTRPDHPEAPSSPKT